MATIVFPILFFNRMPRALSNVNCDILDSPLLLALCPFLFFKKQKSDSKRAKDKKEVRKKVRKKKAKNGEGARARCALFLAARGVQTRRKGGWRRSSPPAE